VALGTLRFLPAEHQSFELMLAALADVLENGHRLTPLLTVFVASTI
jgi:hypothetical protein